MKTNRIINLLKKCRTYGLRCNEGEKGFVWGQKENGELFTIEVKNTSQIALKMEKTGLVLVD